MKLNAKLLKWFILFCLLILLYVIQTTPKLFEVNSIKPFIVLPFILCLSGFLDQLTTFSLTLIAGFMLDYNSEMIYGFNALFLLLFISISFISFKYFIKFNLFISLIFTSIIFLIYSTINIFYHNSIFNGYYNKNTVLFMVGIYIYTLLITPFVYLVVYKINKI